MFNCPNYKKGQFELQFIIETENCRKDKKLRILLIRHEN